MGKRREAVEMFGQGLSVRFIALALNMSQKKTQQLLLDALLEEPLPTEEQTRVGIRLRLDHAAAVCREFSETTDPLVALAAAESLARVEKIRANLIRKGSL